MVECLPHMGKALDLIPSTKNYNIKLNQCHHQFYSDKNKIGTRKASESVLFESLCGRIQSSVKALDFTNPRDALVAGWKYSISL